MRAAFWNKSYEFENRAMEEVLLAWCEENGIQPVAVMVQLRWGRQSGR